MIDYIAPCNGSCTDVDATKLKFVKIAQMGWIDDTWEEGYWASDKLLNDDNRWNITVPKGLEAGEYVLRTEIIVSFHVHCVIACANVMPGTSPGSSCRGRW